MSLESLADDRHHARPRWRQPAVIALCAAVLLCLAAGLALAGIFGSDDARLTGSSRVQVRLTLPDGSPWTGTVYLANAGRKICLTSPPRDHARWAGPGCLSGAFLGSYFQTDPPGFVGAVGVVRDRDGGRSAVVYGYVDSRWHLTKVTSDGVKAKGAIHVSSQRLVLPVDVPNRKDAGLPSQLALHPYAAFVPLADERLDGEVYVYATGPDKRERRHHLYPTT